MDEPRCAWCGFKVVDGDPRRIGTRLLHPTCVGYATETIISHRRYLESYGWVCTPPKVEEEDNDG